MDTTQQIDTFEMVVSTPLNWIFIGLGGLIVIMWLVASLKGRLTLRSTFIMLVGVAFITIPFLATSSEATPDMYKSITKMLKETDKGELKDAIRQCYKAGTDDFLSVPEYHYLVHLHNSLTEDAFEETEDFDLIQSKKDLELTLSK